MSQLFVVSVILLLSVNHAFVEELEDATFDDRVKDEIWMIKFYAPYELSYNYIK